MESSEEQPSFAQRVSGVLKHIPGAALMFAVVPLLVLGYLGWYHYGAEHLDQALYALDQKQLQVTEPPAWVENDLVAEVFSSARLDRVSLLDPKATVRISQAFENHIWVRDVLSVRKSNGGAVAVDLEYREPVASVMVFGQPSADNKRPIIGFRVVDREGFVLPGSESDISRYLVLRVEGTTDEEIVFRDTRITDALVLCNFLAPLSQQLGIAQVTIANDQGLVTSGHWSYGIISKDDHRILWGHVPGQEVSGEVEAAQKVKSLRSQLAQIRQDATLSSGSTQTAGSFIDLRYPPRPSRPVAK
ncbi:MAG: cell division protein FtsQ/DivIB [Aureliella sp.]